MKFLDLALKILGVLALTLFIFFVVTEYWDALKSIDNYNECASITRTVEITPGVHRCNVPFRDQEFFFEECSVENC